ncbi:MAG TPA: STAS domain-containing protein [Streptosporangiaceae bacterium]|nr:STAS domain-containing protein [Streptosporangiaceae bacterium]
MMDEAVQSELLVSAREYDGGGCPVVSLAGRAGIDDCAWIRLLLEQQAEHGHERMVVDLSRLSSMDWWVALILIWTGRVVSRRGGMLILAAPQPAVARLLNAVGTPKAVVMCASVRQARQRAGAPSVSI